MQPDMSHGVYRGGLVSAVMSVEGNGRSVIMVAATN